VCRHAIDLKRRALKAQAPAEPPQAAAGAAAGAAGGAEKETEKGGAPLVTIELVNQAARELQEKPIFKAVQEGLSNVQVRACVRACMPGSRLALHYTYDGGGGRGYCVFSPLPILIPSLIPSHPIPFLPAMPCHAMPCPALTLQPIQPNIRCCC
jgi:hypothetical protein